MPQHNIIWDLVGGVLKAFDGSGDATKAILPATLSTDAAGNGVWLAPGYAAEGYGASVNATATVNTSAFQQAVTNGNGTITVPGIYQINRTVLIPSRGGLTLGPGVTIQLAPGANCNLFRNKHAGVTLAGSQFVRTSNVVTVSEPGHPRNVGDQVLLKNLATDTSFNGLVTITSIIQGVSWNYASSGGNGAPTGFGYCTPADNQLPAANFVRATNVVTVTETGHSRQIGDSVYIDNLATDTTFNGTYQVTSVVVGVSWNYASTGSNGSPTGTAVVAGDNNITIQGGTLDGNTANQSGTAPYTSTSACFGTILGNVGSYRVVGVKFANQTKYGLWSYNASDPFIDQIQLNTISDGVHFEGPVDRWNIGTIQGYSADDMVAFTNTNGATAGSYLGFASPSGLGNFGSGTISALYPGNSAAPALVKIAGDASTTLRSLVIGNIAGSQNSSANVGVAIVDDSASLTGMAVESVVIKSMTLTGGSSTHAWFNINTTGAIKKLRLENPLVTAAWGGLYVINVQAASVNVGRIEMIGYKNDYAMTTGQQGILIAGTVQEVLVDEFEHLPGASNPLVNPNTGSTVASLKVANGTCIGVSKTGYLVSSAGTCPAIQFSNVECKANHSLITQGAGTLTDIFIDNVKMTGTANGTNTTTNCTIYANNFKADSNLGNHLFQINGGTVRIIAKNCAAPTAAKGILFNTGGSVISFTNTDASLPIDMGTTPASQTGETPQAGDMHWNSNATSGGMYGWTLAGAWQKVF